MKNLNSKIHLGGLFRCQKYVLHLWTKGLGDLLATTFFLLRMKENHTWPQGLVRTETTDNLLDSNKLNLFKWPQEII